MHARASYHVSNALYRKGENAARTVGNVQAGIVGAENRVTAPDQRLRRQRLSRT